MSAMRWVCAWCGLQRDLSVQTEDRPVTHGICDACLDRRMPSAAETSVPMSDRECVRSASRTGDV